MVTLCYLRRYLAFLQTLLSEMPTDDYAFSREVAEFFSGLHAVLDSHSSMFSNSVDPAQRKAFMDEAGSLSETYREAIYRGFSGEKASLKKSELMHFLGLSQEVLDSTIKANQRSDGLFHAYNLIKFGEDGYAVENLYEMLEGQVAVLKSGFLSPAESFALLEDLRESRLYSSDQNSYFLYPDRAPTPFLEKNVVSPTQVADVPWIQNEIDAGRREFVEKDINGRVHFNGCYRNAEQLEQALHKAGIGAEISSAVCQVYVDVFGHRRFTGRSGAMYKYEGLGCIYWHMVSKLLLATAEAFTAAAADEDASDRQNQWFEQFVEIREGLGLHKTPAHYGAFPADAYSHTPSFGGVQQPGMTGQVKEDLITRFRELGVDVADGSLGFVPTLLQRSEFATGSETWNFSAGGNEQSLELQAGSMAFCLCGVPVVYRLAHEAGIQVFTQKGDVEKIPGNRLGAHWSQTLFRRGNSISKIEVDVPELCLR
jgi:hypothetical protein